MTGKTLDRDGVRIYYETHGTGPAVLLSHGYSATSQMWQPQIEALSRDHQLILWDFRGHGQSDASDDLAQYSERATVDDIAAILDDVGVDRAVIGGLSLGGYMSLAFNLAHPERVKALMPIDCGPGFKKDEARNGWNDYAESMATSIEEGGSDPSQSPERTQSHHNDVMGVVRAGRTMLKQYDARIIESLPGISVPTLIVVGENDTPFLAGSDYMASKIPGAEKHVIPDAGHAANMDQPARFNEIVLDFLSRHGF